MADENEVLEMLKGLDNKEAQQESELPQEDNVESVEEIEETIEDTEENEAPQSMDVDEDATVIVSVGGEDIEVTFGELRNGYMRQADYTRKTQEAAELKKEIKAERDKFAEANERFLYEIKNSPEDKRYNEIHDALKQVDYSKLSAEEQTAYDRLAREADILEKKLNSKVGQYENHKKYLKDQEAKELAEIRQQENEKLLEAIPELSDPAQKGKIEDDIRNALVHIYGEKDARKVAAKSINHKDVLLYRAAAIGLKYMNSEAPKPTAKKIKNVRSNIKTGQESGKSKSSLLLQQAKEKGYATKDELHKMLIGG